MSADKRFRAMAFLISFCLALWTALPFGWCAATEQPGTIHLREVVEVNHPVVSLSDLLPADTPAAIRQASRAIAICPAPQPGGERVLQREQILGQLAAHLSLAFALAIPTRITIRNPG
jgi:hypothetical protein